MRNVIGSRSDVNREVVDSVNQKHAGSPVSRSHLDIFLINCLVFNSFSVRNYLPGLSGIQGLPKAIQDPPPHEDRPNVQKQVNTKFSDNFFT